MAIRVICTCGARLKARDEAAGKSLRCPTCQASVAIPVQSKLPVTPEPAWQPIEIPITSSLSSPIPASINPGKWLPIVVITVTAIAVGVFLIFNQGEKRQTVPPVAVAAPVKPVGKPAVNAVDASQARAKDDRVRSLLTKADFAYAEDEAQIVRIVKLMIEESQKAGLSLTPEEALEGSLRWPMPGYFARDKRAEFSEYYAIYLTTRTRQQLSHRQTIRQMHYLSSALDLKSKQATSPEFEAAFETASPGCQLAMAESHNMIRGNDPVAEYYGLMVEQVASAYGMTGQEVAAETSFVYVKLQNTNQRAHLDQILLASLSWTKLIGNRGNVHPKFFDFLQAYLTLRAKDSKSHAQACEVLCGQRPDDARPEP